MTSLFKLSVQLERVDIELSILIMISFLLIFVKFLTNYLADLVLVKEISVPYIEGFK